MTFIASTNYLTEVQKGLVDKFSLIHKFGRNETVPNGSWAFVSLLGHTGWPLTAATTVRVKAGNAADDTAGAGAQSITVQGIDSNLDEITEDITTAGASASSATTASFWRVHRAWVKVTGTYGAANTGDVVIENSAGGTDLIKIAAAEGQTQFCGFTIPNTFKGYLNHLIIHADSVNNTRNFNIRLFTREKFNTTSAPNMLPPRIKLFFDGVAGTVDYRPPGPGIVIDELSDVWVEAYGDGTTGEVSASMEIILEDKS